MVVSHSTMSGTMAYNSVWGEQRAGGCVCVSWLGLRNSNLIPSNLLVRWLLHLYLYRDLVIDYANEYALLVLEHPV